MPKLYVHSIFKSIQGEGPFMGRPAVFVRLNKCNLACPLCDTDFSSVSTVVTDHALAMQIKRLSPKPTLVVITGGEPLLQNITYFCRILLTNKYNVQIETNGSINIPSALRILPVTFVCSPKTKPVLDFSRMDAFKYVIDHRYVNPTTGLPTNVLGVDLTDPISGRPFDRQFRQKTYLQPCDDGKTYNSLADFRASKNLQKCIELCEKFEYTLGVQLHKLIGKE